MASKNYDVAIIGAGPGGYVAAIRAAQLGFKVVCIEKRKALGGTCLNIGCIPSKALLDSSEHYHFAKHKAATHGISLSDVKLDLKKMMERKDGVVKTLTQGIAGLFKKNKVDSLFGVGTLKSTAQGVTTIEVVTDAGVETVTASKVLLATGSEPIFPAVLPHNGKTIISSTEALALESVPAHMVVVGGGYIGLEMGSVWARLGSKVTVIEFAERILPAMDKQAAQELYKSLIKQGLEIHLSTKCTGTKANGNRVTVEAEDMLKNQKLSFEADVVLVSAGRKPYTEKLGLENVGLQADKAGRIVVDAHFQTAVPGIFAIGDLIAGPMLAHKAEEEGVAFAEIIAGQAGHVNYDTIPGVIFTWPELAYVGLTEEQLKEKGVAYKAGVFPFMANGKAKAMGDIEGLVKIIADAKTDRVLGVHIVGPHASALISEAVTVMEYGGSSEDIARTCHAHPTLSEVVKEAALDVLGRKIHL